MTSMHVALVAPEGTGGGIENYSEQFQRALEVIGATVTIVPIESPDTWNCWELTRKLKVIPKDADVVHVQFEAGLFGRLAVSGVCTLPLYRRLACLDIPVVTTLHEVHASHSGHSKPVSTALTWRDRLLEGIILRVSDAIVVHTGHVKDILERRHGDYVIEQLRHPVDEPTGPPVDRETARTELDINADIILTTLGWIERKKRYSDVIQALANLDDGIYLLAGQPRHDSDEEVLEEVFSLAEHLGVRNRVRHLGYVADDDLPTLFGATDIAIVPYEQVTQSGAINTALAYKCPVVASSLPPFEELALEYDCIRTYEDPEDLVNHIRLTSTDDVRERLEASAETYATSETWEAFAADTVDLYRHVLGDDSATPDRRT